MIGSRIGPDAFPGIVGTERDPDPLHGGLLAQDAGDRRQDRRRGFAGGQLPADPEQRTRLAFPRPGDLRPRSLERGQLTDHDRDEQEQNEVQPLARVGDGEGEDRMDVQEVVQQERRDGRDDRAPRPGDEGDGDHGREVDRGGVRDPDVLLEETDRHGGDRQRRDGDGQEPAEFSLIDPAHADDRRSCDASSRPRDAATGLGWWISRDRGYGRSALALVGELADHRREGAAQPDRKSGQTTPRPASARRAAHARGHHRNG